MNYQSKYYFTDEDRIERITGVRLPKMNIIEYHQGDRSIIDYSDWLVVKFEEDIDPPLTEVLVYIAPPISLAELFVKLLLEITALFPPT